jgi:tetratricopeptide (TPR) repeat protein
LNDHDFPAEKTRAVRVHIEETLGDNAYLMGDYAQATERYEFAVADCRAGERDPTGSRRMAGLLRKRAVALFQIGQLDAAYGAMEASREHLSQDEEKWVVDRGAWDAWFAWIQVKQGQLNEATELAEKALEQIQRGEESPDWGLPIVVSGNRSLRQSAWGVAENVLGLAALFRCRWVEAEIHYERALGHFEEAGDHYFYAGVLGNLATVHQSCARYAKARECAARSLAILERTPFVLGQIVCHCSLGLTYMIEGEYRFSKPHLMRALELTKQTDDPFNIAESYMNIALWHICCGDVEGAEPSLEEARLLVPADEDPGFDASFLLAKGMLWIEKGRCDAALRPLLEALSLARHNDIPDTEVHVIIQLARAYLELKKGDKAQRLLDELFSRSPEELPENARVKALRVRGQAEAALEKYEEGERWLLESGHVAESLGLRHETARTGKELGQLYYQWGQKKDAVREWRSALELCREIGAVGDAQRLEQLLSDPAHAATVIP